MPQSEPVVLHAQTDCRALNETIKSFLAAMKAETGSLGVHFLLKTSGAEFVLENGIEHVGAGTQKEREKVN